MLSLHGLMLAFPSCVVSHEFVIRLQKHVRRPLIASWKVVSLLVIVVEGSIVVSSSPSSSSGSNNNSSSSASSSGGSTYDTRFGKNELSRVYVCVGFASREHFSITKRSQIILNASKAHTQSHDVTSTPADATTINQHRPLKTPHQRPCDMLWLPETS